MFQLFSVQNFFSLSSSTIYFWLLILLPSCLLFILLPYGHNKLFNLINTCLCYEIIYANILNLDKLYGLKQIFLGNGRKKERKKERKEERKKERKERKKERTELTITTKGKEKERVKHVQGTGSPNLFFIIDRFIRSIPFCLSFVDHRNLKIILSTVISSASLKP